MIIKQNKALSMLSIAAKAGKIASGGFLTEKAIQEGSACAVIIAENASANTRKKFINKCEFNAIPCFVMFDSDTLGRQIGKQERTVLAVTDEGLAKQIADRLDRKDMEV